MNEEVIGKNGAPPSEAFPKGATAMGNILFITLNFNLLLRQGKGK
jgi:hypothetical protein